MAKQRILKNRNSGGDLVLQSSDGTEIMRIDDTTKKLVATAGFDTTGGAGLATSTQAGLVKLSTALTDLTDAGFSSNVEKDVGTSTLTLDAGTYLVKFGTSYRIQSAGIGSSVPRGNLFVTDVSNNKLTSADIYDSGVSITRFGADGGTDQYVGNYALTTTITLASQTTVKLRATIDDFATGSIRSVLNAYMVWDKI